LKVKALWSFRMFGATCRTLQCQIPEDLNFHDCLYICFAESRLEGWLSVPNKQNIRRHGWKKQYVVVSSKKIIFYNSESDKQNTDPVLILDLK